MDKGQCQGQGQGQGQGQIRARENFTSADRSIATCKIVGTSPVGAGITRPHGNMACYVKAGG